MKYAFFSVLAICLTIVFVTWRVERMQTRRTMAALQMVWRAGQ